MKEIAKNFQNYSFVNKELLVNGMGIDESKLKGNLIKASKNGKNTILLPVPYNFILIINKEIDIIEEKKKNKEIIKKEYKNLYYVEEITKKIFILLYFHEKKFQEKLKNKIKDIYNIKKYYLVNSEWLEEYKQFFLYDLIKEKLDEKYQNYSYKKIKSELDNISNEIGQIRLYNETQIPDKIREDFNLQSKTKIIETIKNNDNKNINYAFPQETIEPEEIKKIIEVPINFDLINEDIFELLIKEEFFYNKIEKNKEKLLYEILIGNNQIIIKNKINQKNIDINQILNHYLIYVINKDFQTEKNKQKEDCYKYFIKYILDYDKNSMFFDNFKNIINKSLYSYISDNKIDISKMNYEQNIYDNKKNNL